MNQRGGFPALIDYDWGGNYNIQKFKDRYWMTYIGGEGTGYEAVNAPLSIGLASTAGDVTTAHPWDTYDAPILSYKDKNAQWWEYMTQYKSTVYKVDKKKFGYQFMMYYNAGGKDATHPKGERIGIAFSNDMKKRNVLLLCLQPDTRIQRIQHLCRKPRHDSLDRLAGRRPDHSVKALRRTVCP